jgi:hypothetical protein
MKVSELSGDDLDYWVAKAEGLEAWRHEYRGTLVTSRSGTEFNYAPSCRWEHGGEILARMIESGEFCVWENSGIVVVSNHDPECVPCKEPHKWDIPEVRGEATTMLTAAMRAYVASKYGNAVPDLNDECIAQGGVVLI